MHSGMWMSWWIFNMWWLSLFLVGRQYLRWQHEHWRLQLWWWRLLSRQSSRGMGQILHSMSFYILQKILLTYFFLKIHSVMWMSWWIYTDPRSPPSDYMGYNWKVCSFISILSMHGQWSLKVYEIGIAVTHWKLLVQIMVVPYCHLLFLTPGT